MDVPSNIITHCDFTMHIPSNITHCDVIMSDHCDTILLDLHLPDWSPFGDHIPVNHIKSGHIYIHTYKDTYIHTYVHTYIHIYIHTFNILNGVLSSLRVFYCSPGWHLCHSIKRAFFNPHVDSLTHWQKKVMAQLAHLVHTCIIYS